jgi:predicted transcriptional regulator
MVGVSKIEIEESREHLKTLMHLQTSAMAKERLQVLYLLKSLQAKDITEAARLVGRDRTTVQRWMQKYADGGIKSIPMNKSSYNLGDEFPGKADGSR